MLLSLDKVDISDISESFAGEIAFECECEGMLSTSHRSVESDPDTDTGDNSRAESESRRPKRAEDADAVVSVRSLA